MNIIDKYEEIDIEKVTAFNLTDNKFNIVRETEQVEEFYEAYKADPKADNILKTLAKLNIGSPSTLLSNVPGLIDI